MVTPSLDIPEAAVDEFCHRWNITELSLFGSVLREDFDAESDVDILLTLSPNAHWSLFDLVDMKEELTDLFGRKVDIVTRRGLETSQNRRLRDETLSTAKAIHRDAA